MEGRNDDVCGVLWLGGGLALVNGGAWLLHRTAETEHERRWPAAEVGADALALLRAALADALASGEPVPVDDTGWWLRAVVTGGALACELWRVEVGPHGIPTPEGRPHVTMTVERGDPPVLVAHMAGLSRLPGPLLVAGAMEAGDMERCIAWAWLT